MTPLPGNDPLVRWLQYRKLRDRYLSDINRLKTSCVGLHDGGKGLEVSFMAGLKVTAQEYLVSTNAHHLQIKSLFLKQGWTANSEL
jgi:hypothetical protein